ncbi:NUDIX hydrolase [Bacillus cereus]|uniref:NUDIX domain-containing protein n=1 Tax=Bacillus cereus TaxID=1396 RepID=A0A5B9I2F6_BACCE|nr:NUDIX domain-containing protein [Bacillus cereus]QEF20281.1 NUDIX domain-containing protein [Bacillus cereus]
MNNIFTMCFIENESELLLQKRTSPPFIGLWNAPGGKVEAFESPFEACKREVQEEIGLNLRELYFRGVITVSNTLRKRTSILMLFQANVHSGKLTDSEEGELAWIKKEKIYSYNNVPVSFTYLLPYILESQGIITGKIIYNRGHLEVFDIVI